jgi:hypothetical protein
LRLRVESPNTHFTVRIYVTSPYEHFGMGGFPGGETREMGSMFSELVALDILEVRAKA